MPLTLLLGHRLYYEMDVTWLAPGMRPQADVDLRRFRELRNDRGRPPQKRTQFCCLLAVQVPHVDNMTLRLNDQGADTKRADAMVY